jgi:hypothetical protein
MKVDYKDETCHGKPLWLVYGINCFPSIICCKLESKLHGYTVIWGHSVYRRAPGFRTLGQNIETWMETERTLYSAEFFDFYDTQEEALERLRKLTTPGKNA